MSLKIKTKDLKGVQVLACVVGDVSHYITGSEE